MTRIGETIESIALSTSLLMVIAASLSLLTLDRSVDPNIIAAESRCVTPLSAHTGAICTIRGGVR